MFKRLALAALIIISALSVHVPAMATEELTVVNYAAGVDSTTATLNGDITDTGGGTCTERGFVWDTTQHPDPGNVAPPATYANHWTEAGSFGTGAFSYDITGLTELTTYYFRACAEDALGTWFYSRELSFFIGEEGKVYLEFRPDLDETKIRGQLGIPSDFTRGQFNGYSLPITDFTDNESLNYIMCVPDRWDGKSDILIHIDCATTDNETDNTYQWKILWEHLTPNIDVVPTTLNIITYERDVYSELQYQTYQDWLVIDHDIDIGDTIVADDLIGITIGRIAATKPKTNTGEIVIFAVDVLFARGDFLADPIGEIEDVIDDLIADETLLGGKDMFSLVFALLLAMITILAFAVKDKVASSVLHAVGMMGWLVMSYLLYNGTYPVGNIYFATGAMLFGLIVAIVHTIFVVIPILAYYQGPPQLSYDQEQQQIRSKIEKVTRRKKEEPW